MPKNPNNFYIKNNELYDMIVEWYASGDTTKIPDKMAIAFMQIADNLAKSGRFAGYTWRDEMVADALFSEIKFCRDFKPEKSQNPFAYFTQICWNAFIHRIRIEKDRLAAISEYRDSLDILYDIDTETTDEDGFNNIDNTAKNINGIFRKEDTQRCKQKVRNSAKNPKVKVDDFF